MLTGIQGLLLGSTMNGYKLSKLYLDNNGLIIPSKSSIIVEKMRPKFVDLPDDCKVQYDLPLFQEMKTYHGIVSFGKLMGYKRILSHDTIDIWSFNMKLNCTDHTMFSYFEHKYGIVCYSFIIPYRFKNIHYNNFILNEYLLNECVLSGFGKGVVTKLSSNDDPFI